MRISRQTGRLSGALRPTLRLVLQSVVLVCLTSVALPQGYAPKTAAQKMDVADGLQVKLFASEPEVRQPSLVKCDERGRLWVIQYLQYPNPAGLKRAKIDRWSRTVYDRVPEPPPHGPRGADRITILEDTDGDGQADQFKDFVSGLNIATGLAFGHGGVYVLQLPYLLFYPDRNRDDVPDSDPEVLLKGFGMQDTQSVANHLTWGPDGWLYGLNGSTSTCNIRGIEFQQGVWRYHPLTKEFELFAEGGGNIYGLTFDRKGNLFYSSNGGALFWHAVQGGYYRKSFGKHGPLHNLYTYGYFPHVKHSGVTGGHIVLGGTIYDAEVFPETFHQSFIGANFLGHSASWWRVKPRGSTFEAQQVGTLLDSNDTWFSPTDLALGPDGSMYISDFHDKRTAHPDPDAEWDRSNGRVYKIEAQNAKPVIGLDLERLSSAELVDHLTHSDGWYAAQARRILAHRRDTSIHADLRNGITESENEDSALQYLWALNVSGGFDDRVAADLLSHPAEYVRAWTVRLLGDRRQVSPPLAKQLSALAWADPSVVVRSQLAASAKRLPGGVALPVLAALLDRDLDVQDPHVPLLIWWALESKALSDSDEVVEFFKQAGTWASSMKRDNAQRLIRRYAAEGTTKGYDAALKLARAAPARHLEAALQALDQGLAERGATLAGLGQGGLFEEVAAVTGEPAREPERKYEALTSPLKGWIRNNWSAEPRDLNRTRLAVRAGIEEAYEGVLGVLRDPSSPEDHRLAMLDLLRDLGRPDCIPAVLNQLDRRQSPTVRLRALDVLARFESNDVAKRLLDSYPGALSAQKRKIRGILLSRHATARAFLDAVDQSRFPAAAVAVSELRQLALYNDDEIDEQVRQHWGNIRPGTTEEKLAVMRRYRNDLNAGEGDPRRGHLLFIEHCASCHRLFGEGGTLGTDLTGANRSDQAALLAALVDPSATVRTEYVTYLVRTQSGRTVRGVVEHEDAAGVTLVDSAHQKTRIARGDVQSMEVAPESLMPENLLDRLEPQDLRDLFRYLQQDAP